jgi:hypothetical protein
MEVLSLGGGVQSTTALRMSIKGELPRLDAVIFADTGWEEERVYAHLDALEAECLSAEVPFYRVSAGNIRESAISNIEAGSRFVSLPLHVRNTEGKGAMLRRQCTSEFKIVPIEQKLRELLGVAKGQRVPAGVHVRQWIGISLDEAQRMKINPHKWVQNFYPLVDERMTRHDCIGWLVRNGFSEPAKSACKGCPFHDNAYWRRMRDEVPADFADVVDFDAAIRTGLQSVDCDSYLHRSLVPLSEVDLRTAEDRGQMAMFTAQGKEPVEVDMGGFINECEGMCGV